MARIIQFKRNASISQNAEAARNAILAMVNSLADGEIVINSYYDTYARGGVADLIGVKTQGNKIFFFDNQVILNKLGINDDGTINEDITGGIEEILNQLTGDVETLKTDVETLSGDVDGLKTDVETLSGDVDAMGDKVDALESEVNDLNGDVEALSGKVDTNTANIETVSGKVETLEDDVDGLKTDVETISGKVDTVSGKVETLETNVQAISGKVDTNTANINALSAKTIAHVEDTATIDITKEEYNSDGTQQIKADVKLSATAGNIITANADGLWAQVDYNSATNALVVNGVEKTLNAGSIIDSITYDAQTMELVITYTDTTGTQHVTRVSLADLVDTYDFPAKDTNHNVGFTTTTTTGGTSVQADVSIMDCGEY